MELTEMLYLLMSNIPLEVGFTLGRTGKQDWNSDVQKLRPAGAEVQEFGKYLWWESTDEDLRLCYAVLQEAIK